MDSIRPGMRAFLEDVELESDPINKECIDDKAQAFGEYVTGDLLQVWRALKNITDG